jgi:hypothetical protein
VVDVCLEHGIAPMVTLHHFSRPRWLIGQRVLLWAVGLGALRLQVSPRPRAALLLRRLVAPGGVRFSHETALTQYVTPAG